MDLELFAERLTSLRQEKGLTMKELGQATGFTHTAISYWESAKRMPSAGNLYELALFFGVSANFLIGLDD